MVVQFLRVAYGVVSIRRWKVATKITVFVISQYLVAETERISIRSRRIEGTERIRNEYLYRVCDRSSKDDE